MLPVIEQNKDAIAAICRKHDVKRLELFGSAARETDGAKVGDVDVLVDFLDYDSPALADQWFGLGEDIEAVLAKKVDLSSSRGIRNPYFLEAIQPDRICPVETLLDPVGWTILALGQPLILTCEARCTLPAIRPMVS